MVKNLLSEEKKLLFLSSNNLNNESAKKLIEIFVSKEIEKKEIDILAKAIYEYLKSQNIKFKFELAWVLQSHIKEVRELQNSFIQTVKNICSSQNSTDKTFLKEWYNISKNSELNVISLSFDDWHILASPVSKILTPVLYHSFKKLIEREITRLRGKRCKGCNKKFLPNPFRKQLYCCDRCRYYYNNYRRTKSGEHSTYMKRWRDKKKGAISNCPSPSL